jgi:hypothetical protein
VLSTTTKAKARKERKDGKADGESEVGSPQPKKKDLEDKKDEDMANEEAKKEEEN